MAVNVTVKTQKVTTSPDLSEKRVRRYSAKYFAVPSRLVRVEPLTPDASTRKYYRVCSDKDPSRTLIVSLYPAPFNPQDNSYLDVTRLFERSGLPVPVVIDVAGTQGIILQEDLGDLSLAKWIELELQAGEHARIDAMLCRAIDLIVQIQSTTQTAYETGSVASKLAFDEDKLGWELNFFFDHYFGSLRHDSFEPDQEAAIRADLAAIAKALSDRPRTLCHRDYHAMNLMVDRLGNLRIIDHQDARMGPASYDLVPLLVERRLVPAAQSWVDGQIDYFLKARAEAGLPSIERTGFIDEFNLMTIQRQLKATGTFSYQTGVLGRGEYYAQYVEAAVKTVLRAMDAHPTLEFPALRAALEKENIRIQALSGCDQ